ncbi:hypothetical protein GIB67_009300 [Kingdonia uniflora]|uniref:DUF8040 domain-containing protein n=1 Tax=Kingdonia uniflora TaxID=39325 RepID=A0A7J7N2J6_9MAGN|nr:hypothetical protein GIB67_009300 [Kingdonia uniflora]
MRGKGLRASKHLDVEEQVVIFLFIVGHDTRFRHTQASTMRSLETISKYFYVVLKLGKDLINMQLMTCLLPLETIIILGPTLTSRIVMKPWMAHSSLQQSPLKINLAEIFAGWEDLAHGSRILRAALNDMHPFTVPRGRGRTEGASSASNFGRGRERTEGVTRGLIAGRGRGRAMQINQQMCVDEWVSNSVPVKAPQLQEMPLLVIPPMPPRTYAILNSYKGTIKPPSMVLEERIASEMQRLKLKYFGDQSLEMLIPAPVPLTYQGLSEDEAVKAEEKFYYKLRVKITEARRTKGVNASECLNDLLLVKTSDMDSRNASVPKPRMGRARRNNCRPLEREILNSASTSSFKHFSTSKNLESTERETQKNCRGFSKDLSLGDQQSKRVASTESHRWRYNSVVREGLDATADSHYATEVEMDSLPINVVSTSGRTVESDSEVKVGLEQFLCFPGKLVTYPPGSDVFKEFCKAKATIGGKWGNCVEYLEYGLSLPFTNLAKGIMNTIGACHVQLNGNMWVKITVCDHLNKKWENEGKVRRISPEDILQFYGVKNYQASGGAYFCVSATRRRFFDLNSASQAWNDNVIWVKGNCHQRDDEEPLDLLFRILKQSPKSRVERKDSLLDEVTEKEVEIEFVLEGLGQSRKKRIGRKSIKVQKSQLTRPMAGVDDGKKMGTGGEASGTTGSSEVDKKEKRRRIEPSGRSGEKVTEECRGRVREGNENIEDRHVKVHFKLIEATQAVVDLTRKVEEKDAKIEKGIKELAESKEHAIKL